MKHALILLAALFFAGHAEARYALIPMGSSQTNHLKAYGVIFNHLEDDDAAQWLLNYRGGSFLAEETSELIRNCRLRGVYVETISSAEARRIVAEIEQPNVNMGVVNLEKAPEIAVYTPGHALPWDDAVTLALTYAEVPYTTIYNEEVLDGELEDYDWLHLHHEDFTGQYGKFWQAYRSFPWYTRQVQDLENMAGELGYSKVSDMKKAVVLTITDYISRGGFLFAMCSGTDTFDIALAGEDVDIVPSEFDGDPPDPNANELLDFSNTLAFTDFTVNLNRSDYENADIDIPDVQSRVDQVDEEMDFFTLFDFSAKWDPVPSMLTQNHVSSIKGFYGQTTAFIKDKIKSSVVILAETSGRDEVKYLHGNHGEGTFTFYAGHDPEDYTHRVSDPPTDLNLYPGSPGYRLILNNILFPAAQKQEMKTMLNTHEQSAYSYGPNALFEILLNHNNSH
ncbi:MAG: asparagine synthetase B [Balneolales bacterium]